MLIKCSVCGEQFEDIISYQHLSKHKLSVKKYKELYGPNTAPNFDWKEYIKSKNSHRKGVPLSSAHRQSLNDAFALREKKYQSGQLIRASYSMSDQNKKLHSDRMKKFATENPNIVSERVKKAQATRKLSGPGNRSGSTLTEESKQKISQSLKILGKRIQQETLEKYSAVAKQQNITIINRAETTVFLKCNQCQFEFSRSLQLFQPNKFQEELCPVCFPKHSGPTSKAEQEIADFLSSLKCGAVITRCRDIISPRELDIYLPEHKLAIEYCGIYWHSEVAGKKGQHYHREKWEQCKQKQIKLITIFEDEWKNHKDLICSMLRHQVKQKSNTKVYARKCQILKIDSKLSSEFLNKNHIHGSAAAEIHLGLYYNNQLVYVMSFTRHNISRNNTQNWEIQRMAGLINVAVVGGASKLFNYFTKTYNPENMISYADLRWFTGNSYQHLGFSLSQNTKPGYWYIDRNFTSRKHRYSLRKNKFDDQNLTEWQNRQLQGWDRIWDCGHAKWIWQKNGRE